MQIVPLIVNNKGFFIVISFIIEIRIAMLGIICYLYFVYFNDKIYLVS